MTDSPATLERRRRRESQEARESRYRFNVRAMVRVCREGAAALRSEAAMGWPPITLACRPIDGEQQVVISRADAAVSMDAQADRWQLREIDTGIPNVYDREEVRIVTDDYLSEAVLLEDVKDGIARVRPLLAGRDPGVVGAILADLLATWLAGHQMGDSVRDTRDLRDQLLETHVHLVRQLIPPNAKTMGTIE